MTFQDKNAVKAATITPDDKSLGEVMKGERWGLDEVDWFYKYVLSTLMGMQHKGIYDLLITPISGDFNRIAANGKAWEDCGKMLSTIAENMGGNAATLHDRYWKGPAGDAFFEHIDKQWTVALEISAEVCNWMNKGFEKLSELCVKVATQCANILNSILQRIIALAGRLVPENPLNWPKYVSWVMKAVKWAHEGYHASQLPFVDDIMAIFHLIRDVQKLHQVIKDLVESMQKYFTGFQQAIDAVKQIPQADSSASIINRSRDLRDATDETAKQKKSFDENKKKFNDQLDGMQKKVTS